MGISFKVSRVGKRYQPKVVEEKEEILIVESPSHAVDGGAQQRETSVDALVGVRDHTADSQDHEVSFSINLFPDGFSIGNPDEGFVVPLVRGVPQLLHPYGKPSNNIFSSIENGLLPGDFFDDIPCKYVNGTVTCEVRDYRECVTQSGEVWEGKSPAVHKVPLKMCMENVVKDMSSILGSCTYNDFLEIESRITKSLQPELCLDPKPNLDRLCKSPVSNKLNLGIFADRDLRKQKTTPPANPGSSDQQQRNSVSYKEVLDSLPPPSYLATKGKGVTCVQQPMTMGFQNKEIKEPNYHTVASLNVSSMPEHDLTGSSLSGTSSSIAGQLTTWANTKRSKQEALEMVHDQSDFYGNRGSITGQLASWANINVNQETGIGNNQMQSQVQFSPHSTSHVLPSSNWGQVVQNIRSSKVPRGSAAESSRSEESTMGVPRSLSATTVAGLQKEEATPMPNMSVKTAAANQASVSAKRKSISLSNAVSGIGPSSSLINMNVPCTAHSPLVGNPCPPSPFLKKTVTQRSSLIADTPHTTSTSCSQEPNFAMNSMPGNGARMLPPLALISGQSPYMPSPSSSSSLALNHQQLPFQNAVPSSHSVTPDWIKAALQLPDASKPHQMDGAVHLSSLNQEQQQPHFKRSSLSTGNTCNQLGNIKTSSSNQAMSAAHLEILLHRQQRQNPIMNKKMGGLREVAAVKTLQSGGGGGVRGVGNPVGLGLMSKNPGMSNLASAPMGNHIPEAGNVGQINNLSSTSGASCFGNLNQHLLHGRLSPAAQAAAFAEVRIANSRRRVMPGEMSFPLNLAARMRGNDLMHGDLLLGQASSSGGRRVMPGEMSFPVNLDAGMRGNNMMHGQASSSGGIFNVSARPPAQQQSQVVNSLSEQLDSPEIHLT